VRPHPAPPPDTPLSSSSPPRTCRMVLELDIEPYQDLGTFRPALLSSLFNLLQVLCRSNPPSIKYRGACFGPSMVDASFKITSSCRIRCLRDGHINACRLISTHTTRFVLSNRIFQPKVWTNEDVQVWNTSYTEHGQLYCRGETPGVGD